MSEPVKYQFDIVVLAHGHLDLTMRCIKAIYKHTTFPFHLIVSDDSTPDMDEETDLTPEWMERFRNSHNNVTYIHSDTPYKTSHQQFTEIFKHCKTPYLVVCVNSLVVEPEWEIAAMQIMRTNPQIGILGFKCLRYGTELIESAGLALVVSGGTMTDIGRGQSGHRFSKVYECDMVQWAFVLLRKEAVEQNLGEPVYHGYKGGEEYETCFTVRDTLIDKNDPAKGKWKIFYCGLGVGYHQTLATRVAKGKEDILLNLQNKEIMCKRWGLWNAYHKFNPGVGEFFPEMKARERTLDPILVVDPTGVVMNKGEKMFRTTDEETKWS